MKKIILATIISLCASAPMAIDAAPQQKAAPMEIVEVNTVEVNDNITVASDQQKTVQAQSETPTETAKRLTPEQRNKKIKEADSSGIGITLMSMAIVIISLIILSLLFMAFGKISQRMQTKKRLKDYGIAHDDDNHEASSGEACAAIAAALYQYFNDRHDVEDTVLTMRKLKRAYSPWSSKLYGLRQVPERNNWHR